MTVSASVRTSRLFWPVGEAAQADYETLRAQVLDVGCLPDTMVAARFGRRGLAGLITWPASEPIFDAAMVGATRPPWSPHHDPRLEILAEGFAFLLNTVEHPHPGVLTDGSPRQRRSW